MSLFVVRVTMPGDLAMIPNPMAVVQRLAILGFRAFILPPPMGWQEVEEACTEIVATTELSNPPPSQIMRGLAALQDSLSLKVALFEYEVKFEHQLPPVAPA